MPVHFLSINISDDEGVNDYSVNFKRGANEEKIGVWKYSNWIFENSQLEKVKFEKFKQIVEVTLLRYFVQTLVHSSSSRNYIYLLHDFHS